MWLGLNASLQHALPLNLAAAAASAVRSTSSSASTAQPSVTQLGDVGVTVLQIETLQPWGRSYESILAALEADGRFYVEGDGSFVACGHETVGPENQQTLWLGDDDSLVKTAPTPGWRPPADSGISTVVWRIEGNLFAGTDDLDYATVNGYAPWREWLRFLQMLEPRLTTREGGQTAGSTVTELVVQLHRFGQYIRLAGPPHGVS
jgi:hypothetical protein